MPTLLHIDSSPLESSISRELTREFVSTWKTRHPGAGVLYRDLAVDTPPPVTQAWVQAVYTPSDALTAEQKTLLALSDRLIEELLAADELVIGSPMHNFTISSSLKLWIDQVARAGRTFRYTATGPEGLLKGKKAHLLIATGGVYTPGTPYAAYNFVEPYVRTILGFLGITDVNAITAGGVAQLQSGSIDRATLLQPALEQIRGAA
jgi:FMN-dependent NADH-azoreductase